MTDYSFSLLSRLSRREVEKTGANMETLEFDTLYKLNMLILKWSSYVKWDEPIYIFKNGINSGKHVSPGHKKGLAVDVYHGRKIADHEAVRFVLMAVQCGFSRVGVYKNHKNYYSFHLEVADTIGTWFHKINADKTRIKLPLEFKVG